MPGAPFNTILSRVSARWRTPFRSALALVIASFCTLPIAQAETPRTPPPLADVTEIPTPPRNLPPRTAADVLDAPAGEAPDGLPRVAITIDGDVYPGSWRKLEGRITTAATSITEVEWIQKSGPKALTPESFFKNRDLWLFLIKPGNYEFTFRAKNPTGWSAPAEVRFAVMQGRPYITEHDGFQLAGSCERIVLPGSNWRQIAGPEAAFRPAENGVAIRPNDAGLYIFEAARLEDGLTERRGILVPPLKDGPLGDRRPVADLPKNLTGFAGRPVILDGSLSMDPDTGDTLKARWSTPDLARGVTLEPQPGLRGAFKADRPGTYAATLIVSDGQLDSLPVSVYIDIAPSDAADDAAANDLDTPPGENPDGSAPQKDLLTRRISFAIWPPEALADGTLTIPDDSGLERAVELFPRRCGIDLVIDPGVARPGHFKEFSLALEANKTPLLHLLDGIARQTNTRYRRDANRALFLLKPTDGFRDEKLESAAAGIDALHEKADASDLLAPIQEFFKSSLTREGTSILFEADQQAFFAVLPKTACQRLREIVQALREPRGTSLPIPEPETKAEERLRLILSEKTVTMHGRYRLDRLLRELTRNTGVAISLDPKPFVKGLPYLKISYDDVPLRQVLRDICEDAGFDGCSIEAPAGAWFYKGPRPYPSGELLWDSAEVRAYDLSSLFAALTPEASLYLTGETIAHQVRSHVYPASWNDPGTFIFYHRGTQKLIVVHAPAAQKKVVEYLNDLRERGHWAIGPLE